MKSASRKKVRIMAKTERVILALEPALKSEAMEASKDKRGGLSQVIRELLIEWLAKRRGKAKSK